MSCFVRLRHKSRMFWILISGAVSILSACTARTPVSDLDRVHAEKLVDRGALYLKIYDYPRATASFALSLETAPNAAALDGLGCVAMLEGDLSEAEKYFERAIELDPSYTSSLGNLGLLYELRGKRGQARKYYEQALRTSPRDPRVLQNYGALTFDAGGGEETSRGLILQSEALRTHPLINHNRTAYADEDKRKQ